MATRDHGPRGDKAAFIHRGLSFTRHTERDDQMGEPWTEHDGHGIVTGWLDYRDDNIYGDDWVLVRDRHRVRYYDYPESLKIAIRDQWGPPVAGHTPEQNAEAAVRADFEHLRAWANDEWEWVGVIVTLDGGGRECTASVWGIESSAAGYIEECARELADQIIEEAGDQLEAEINRLNQLRATVGAATREGVGDGN